MQRDPVQTRGIESAKLRSRNQLGTELGNGEIRLTAAPVGLGSPHRRRRRLVPSILAPSDSEIRLRGNESAREVNWRQSVHDGVPLLQPLKPASWVAATRTDPRRTAAYVLMTTAI